MRVVAFFLSLLLFYACAKDSLSYPQRQDSATTVTNATAIEKQRALALIEKELISSKQAIYSKTPGRVIKENPKPLYVHYMPWFNSLDYDGFWSQHWTMTNKNPNIILPNGQREIAAHYYPLIGPYSSKDPDLHAYHLLLMKLCGIDGVIFDWYGSRDLHDYDLLLKNTESFIPKIEEIGLSFSIMYEDRVASQRATSKAIEDVIASAKRDIDYIANTYFTSANYLKLKNKEVLFMFGPAQITDPTHWETIFSILPNPVSVFSLWKTKQYLGSFGFGEYSWVDKGHLDTLIGYRSYILENVIPIIGGVYPGFNDFYYEGGWRFSPEQDWTLPHTNLNTFYESLAIWQDSPADFMQLITWNDFGEGTMIEPTTAFGFSYLQAVQQYTGVPYSVSDLELVYQLYSLRKKHIAHTEVVLLLDKVENYLYTLQLTKARALLAAIAIHYP